MDNDFELARALQAQFDEEDAHEEVSSFIPEEFRFGSPAKKIRPVSENAPETSIIAPEWEDLDPTPGIRITNLWDLWMAGLIRHCQDKRSEKI